MKYFLDTPIGWLKLEGTATALEQIIFLDAAPIEQNNAPELEQYATELMEYFAGTRKGFSIPYTIKAAEFTTKTRTALTQIPYGSTDSYGGLAKKLGNPKAARAIGNACNKNPLPIVIPCHRIIGMNGNLTGFAGGLGRKEWLLNHEQQHRQTA